MSGWKQWPNNFISSHPRHGRQEIKLAYSLHNAMCVADLAQAALNSGGTDDSTTCRAVYVAPDAGASTRAS